MKVKLSYAIIYCIIIFLPLTPHAKEAKEIFLQTGHSGSVESVCFSPDGKLMASGSVIIRSSYGMSKMAL